MSLPGLRQPELHKQHIVVNWIVSHPHYTFLIMKITPAACKAEATKSFPVKDDDKALLAAGTPSVWVEDVRLSPHPRVSFETSQRFVLIFIHSSLLALYIFFVHLQIHLWVQF